MNKQERQTETIPEEVQEELRKMEERRERDLLWTGERTIKETYLHISSIYADLAKTLRDFVSGLPEGGLNISDKYTDVSMYSGIISEYYRQKSERVSVDGDLADRLYSPGWETLRVLSDLPTEILSEIKQDLREEEDSPTYGTSLSIVREVGKIIQEYLPTLSPEETESTLFPESPTLEDKEDFIIQDRIAVLRVLQTSKRLEREIKEIKDKVSPKLREKFGEYTRTTDIVLDSLSRYLGKGQGDISLTEAKRRYYNSKEVNSALSDLLEEKDQYYTIQRENGKIRIIEYKSQTPETALEALRDLAQIQKSSKSGQIRVSKDLLETEILSRGDTFSLIRQDTRTTDKQKEDTIRHIQKLQKKGRLLRGSMEGLSGGEPYFKIFTIALAQTLNEQIKFYQTEETGSGLPLELAKKYTGQNVILKEDKKLPLYAGGKYSGTEIRPYPYILVSYEDLAKKTKGTDKISGGKDTEYIKEYIESLQNKEYLLSDGKGGLLGLPFIHREVSLYLEKNGKEIGCILRLSPQFSKTIRGYSALRADTIQLLGGGKQKEITMNLLDILIYTRGVSGGVYKKSKEDLLSQIATAKMYKKSKKDRERDFQEAIQKAKDSKIISKYREEKNSGGEVVSVFTYNPDYFKGEDIPEIDVQ